MKRPVLIPLLILAALTVPAIQANVVRPAPDFLFHGAGDRASSLKSLRGQPVIVLVAPDHRHGAFRKQTKYLERLYRKFASSETVFVAAFTADDGRAESDIPFVYPVDPVGLAASLGATDGYLAVVIGEDGNMDLMTSEIHAPEFFEAVIKNGYPVQARQRR